MFELLVPTDQIYTAAQETLEILPKETPIATAPNMLLLGLLLFGLWILTVILSYFVIKKYRKKVEGMKSLEQLKLLKQDLPDNVYEKQLAEISITQTSGVLILLSSIYTCLLFSVTFGATIAYIFYLV